MNAKLNFEFGDNELKKELVEFSLSNYFNEKYFQCNGPTKKRFFCQLSNFDLPFSEKIIQTRTDFYNRVGIKNFEEENNYGIFLGLNLEGGFVVPHRDMNDLNRVHTRINFLLSKPVKGGNIVINNKKIELQENEGWINLASKWLHGSTPVEGSKPRIVLSYGASVDKTIINSLNIHI